MAIDEIQVEDIVIFTGTFKDKNDVVVDISAATTKDIIFQNDKELVLTKAGTFVNTGTDGKLTYTSNTTDLNRSGLWKWQMFVVGPGLSNHTEVKTFPVRENLTHTH